MDTTATIAKQMLYTTVKHEDIVPLTEQEEHELFLAALGDEPASTVEHVESRRALNGMTITHTRGNYDDGEPCTGFHVRDADGEFVDFYRADVGARVFDDSQVFSYMHDDSQ